jgi:hypothetical protein
VQLEQNKYLEDMRKSGILKPGFLLLLADFFDFTKISAAKDLQIIK